MCFYKFINVQNVEHRSRVLIQGRLSFVLVPCPLSRAEVLTHGEPDSLENERRVIWIECIYNIYI